MDAIDEAVRSVLKFDKQKLLTDYIKFAEELKEEIKIAKVREMENEEHKEGEEDEEELDFEFCNGFDYQCRKAYQIAKDHGWHEKPCNDGEVLALIHCEISEALQALRDGNKPDHHCPDFSSLEIELADAIIRIMDYAGERGLNLSLAILEKMKFNKKRPYKHGKNF